METTSDKSHEMNAFQQHRVPEEIILKILSYLRVPDRNNAILVCKYWLGLLFLPQMNRDVKLNLSNAYMRGGFPPIRELRKITRPIANVKIGQISWKFWGASHGIFKKIGSSVTHLYFSDNNLQRNSVMFSEILEHFPIIQEVHLKFLDCLNVLSLEKLPETLQKLHFNEVKISISKHNSHVLDEWMKTAKDVRIDQLLLEPMRNNGNVKLCDMSAELANVLSESWQAKWIGVTIKSRKTPIGFDDVTAVAIQKVPTHHLELCSQLKKLSLTISNVTGCFFTHEVLKLPSISKIIIKRADDSDEETDEKHPDCQVCVDFMLESCENVHSWYIEIGFQAVQIILSASKNLKHVQVDCQTSSLLNLDVILGFIKSFHHLKKLKVHNLATTRFDSWKPMPCLETLHISVENIAEKVSLPIEMIVTNCPEIRSFELSSTLSSKPGPAVKFSQLRMMMRDWKYLVTLKVSLTPLCLEKDVLLLLEVYCKELKNLHLHGKKLHSSSTLCYKMFKRVAKLKNVDINSFKSMSNCDYWKARLKSRKEVSDTEDDDGDEEDAVPLNMVPRFFGNMINELFMAMGDIEGRRRRPVVLDQSSDVDSSDEEEVPAIDDDENGDDDDGWRDINSSDENSSDSESSTNSDNLDRVNPILAAAVFDQLFKSRVNDDSDGSSLDNIEVLEDNQDTDNEVH